MTLWHYGQPLVFDKKINDWFLSELIRPKMDYLLMVFLSENKIYYSLRYWKGADTPWTTPQLVSNMPYQGKVQSFVSISSHGKGFLQIAVKLTDNRIDMIWINPADLEEIKELEKEDKDPPKLRVEGKNIYFLDGGTEVFKGVGISRRSMLNRANGDYHSLYGKPLRFYEDLTIEYGLNFVRHSTTRNTQLLADHLQYMYENNIVVELTIWDGEGREWYLGDPFVSMDIASNFPNVIIDPVNELTDRHSVNMARDLSREAKDRGLIVSAGAFGGNDRRWSDMLLEDCPNDIIGIHRGDNNDPDYDPNFLVRYRDSDKPFIRTETHHLSKNDIEIVMSDDLYMGASIVNYYGLRCAELFPDLGDNIDPDPWREYFEIAKIILENI